MEVPCPVPLSQPWSPVGYQVVQVGEEKKTSLDGIPPKVRLKLARSPLGYRVNVVADEDIPLPPRAKRQWSRSAKPPVRPLVIWGPIAAGVLFLLLPMMAIGLAVANREPEPQPQFVQVQHFEPIPVAAPEVVIPKDLLKAVPEKPAAKEKVEIPQPAPKNQPQAKLEDIAGCENFGTQLEFVRNPQVAARMARDEGKLTFLLHVSGNFEDARFT
jgi:hypothetical protein